MWHQPLSPIVPHHPPSSAIQPSPTTIFSDVIAVTKTDEKISILLPWSNELAEYLPTTLLHIVLADIEADNVLAGTEVVKETTAISNALDSGRTIVHKDKYYTIQSPTPGSCLVISRHLSLSFVIPCHPLSSIRFADEICQ